MRFVDDFGGPDLYIAVCARVNREIRPGQGLPRMRRGSKRR
jgi:hypothetical protein